MRLDGEHLGMNDEWIHCPLADVCTEINYGLTASASGDPDGPKFLRITDIVSGQLDWDTVPHVPVNEATLSKYLLNDQDIVIARTGASTGTSLYIKNPPLALFASYLVRLRIKPEFDPRFVSYYLKSDQFWGYMHGVLGDKSAQPNASARTMTSAPFRAPKSLEEQRAIAHILGTLDDKIELNRQMNQTLQAMARAIFQDWFVDFGPVRAKMEGQDPYLPPELWDLFPDDMVDSELGEIPEGWEVKKLGEMLDKLVSGARPPGGAVTEGIPSIGAENINGIGQHDYSKEKYVPIKFMERLKVKGSQVRDRDVLLYKDGAKIGRKTYVDCGYPHSICTVNEHVFILRMKDTRTQRYLFFWLDQDWMTSEITNLNSNTAQPGINQIGVRSLPFVLPSPTILHTFDDIAGELTRKLFANCQESHSLAAQRDALLPDLFSGESRLGKNYQEHML